VEASELLELFLWKNISEVKRSMMSDTEFRRMVEEELADIRAVCGLHPVGTTPTASAALVGPIRTCCLSRRFSMKEIPRSVRLQKHLFVTGLEGGPHFFDLPVHSPRSAV